MEISEIIAHTIKLVAIPSTADNKHALKQALDYVADFVRAHTEVTIEWFEQNGKPSFLAYRGHVRPERFDIILNGHVDVVAAKPEMFTAYEQNGRLYGRGALDMKGTLMVLASVFCQVVQDSPLTIGLQVVSDEETGGTDGTLYQLQQGVKTDLALIGEYANHPATIYNEARGLCWTEIAFKGKSAHGGHPWNGHNAIVRASDFITALLQRYPIPTSETWRHTSATIASMTTPNDTYNKVPDYAVVKVDFRFSSDDTVFTSEDSVRAFIASIDPEAELIDLATHGAAVHVPEDNPYVRGLTYALRATAGTASLMGRPAGSDGRLFAGAGMDCLEFGLYGQGSHGEHEYVEIASFQQYRDTLLAFLQTPKR